MYILRNWSKKIAIEMRQTNETKSENIEQIIISRVLRSYRKRE